MRGCMEGGYEEYEYHQARVDELAYEAQAAYNAQAEYEASFPPPPDFNDYLRELEELNQLTNE